MFFPSILIYTIHGKLSIKIGENKILYKNIHRLSYKYKQVYQNNIFNNVLIFHCLFQKPEELGIIQSKFYANSHFCIQQNYISNSKEK